jgi:hypothetical protein
MAETYLASNIGAAGMEAKYDAQAKKLLSTKVILAWILKHCTDEFAGYEIDEILKHIENPAVASVYVHQDSAPFEESFDDGCGDRLIHGVNSEDKPIDEAKISYDILFEASLPDAHPERNKQIKLWINLEAQQKINPGYSLLKRAIYYCSRLMSRQFGRDVSSPDYDGIQKVYSIWICPTPDRKRYSTINKYTIGETCVLGDYQDDPANYNVMTAVLVGLDPSKERGNQGHDLSSPEALIGMLSTLLSSQVSPKEKMNILQNSYNISTTDTIKEGVEYMCNLSQGIKDETIRANVIGLLRLGTVSKEDIAKGLNITLAEVEEIAQDMKESSAEQK